MVYIFSLKSFAQLRRGNSIRLKRPAIWTTPNFESVFADKNLAIAFMVSSTNVFLELDTNPNATLGESEDLQYTVNNGGI